MAQRAGSSRRLARGAAVAATALLAACAGPPGAVHARLAGALDAGIELYEAGELERAAERFREAASLAGRLGDVEFARRATAAECLGWLRARRLGALAECSERLEVLQRFTRSFEPGVNTLIALGAVAGGRPIPALPIPAAVRPLIERAAGG